MPLPSDLTKITVTGTFIDPAGNGVAGSVAFSAPVAVYDATGLAIISTVPVVAKLDGNGSFSTVLPCTDNAGMSPTGWGYSILISTAQQQTLGLYTGVPIPHTLGSTADLSAILPPAQAPVGPPNSYAQLANDLGGTPTAPIVVGTHLAAPLPLAQGGTGSATKNFVDLTTGQTVAGAKTFTSALVANATGATGTPPYGASGSNAPTGLVLGSSYPSDDVGGGTDGTGRVNLYSYQRANVASFGETIRNFLMRSDAKAMTAWYGSQGLYNGTTRDATGTAFKPWCWTGAHFEANDHGSVHGHYEIEIPDSTGALQGRFEIPFIDQSKLSNTIASTTIGIDYTNIRTNLADFTVRAQNIATGDYAGQNTCFRVGGNNTVNKDILLSISSDMQTSGRRWAFRANTTTEAGANAGTDLQVLRYADDGTQLGTALFFQRSDGQITTGATGGRSARMALVWGTSAIAGFSAQPTASIGASAAFDAQMFASTERIVNAKVTGDAATRFVAYADGKHEWGDGTNTRDANLYRSAAGVLKTDQALQAATALGIGQAPPATGAGITTAADTAAWTSTNTTVAGNTGQPHLAAFSATATSLFTTSRVTGDSSSRFAAQVDGKMAWGSGSATRDANLYRAAAGVIATDNNLDVVTHALGQAQPREHGLVAWTGDPITVPSSVASSAGAIVLSALYVNRAVSITKILWGIGTAGSGVVAGQNFIGLVDPSGTVIATVGVDARVTTTGLFTETISSTALLPGTYRVAFLFNATGMPQVYRHDSLNAALVNVGITSAANYRFATNGSGATALPGSFTLSSNATTVNTCFAALQQ